MRFSSLPDLDELIPFIRAVAAAIRPTKPREELSPPDRGVLPPEPYREGICTPLLADLPDTRETE